MRDVFSCIGFSFNFSNIVVWKSGRRCAIGTCIHKEFTFMLSRSQCVKYRRSPFWEGFLERLLCWSNSSPVNMAVHSALRGPVARGVVFCRGAEGNACTSRNRSLRTEQNRQRQATDILVGRACFLINMRDTLCTRSAAWAAWLRASKVFEYSRGEVSMLRL